MPDALCVGSPLWGSLSACLSPYMPTCLFGYLPVGVYAYVGVCLYAYAPLSVPMTGSVSGWVSVRPSLIGAPSGFMCEAALSLSDAVMICLPVFLTDAYLPVQLFPYPGICLSGSHLGLFVAV